MPCSLRNHCMGKCNIKPLNHSLFSRSRFVFHQVFLFPKRCRLSAFQFTLNMCYYFQCYHLYCTPLLLCLSQSQTQLQYPNISRPLCLPPLSHLVCRHLALGGLVRLQALIERSLDGLHLGGNGLEGLLIMLLSLQSLVQTLLLLADLW